ncbi:MAG: ABC transporter permease [Oscillospiraceae bacterium]|nr:ABC transporter permease [Oscillospiraceae bacterium]
MNKKAVFVYIVGIALMLSSFIYINHAATQVGTILPQDTMIVAPIKHDVAFMFDTERVMAWSNSYNGFAATERVTIQALSNQAMFGFAQMSVVSSDYFHMMQLPFIYGSPELARDGQVVVLCRNMAWTLFGSVDVVGLSTKIMGSEYTVVGIVEAIADSTLTADGFAWIPCSGSEMAGILYVSPANYIPLSARLDTQRLLVHLGLNDDFFSVTDGNLYGDSIVLRAQLLLVLSVPGFLIFGAIWVIRLFRLAESKIAYVVAGIFAVLLASVTVYFAWSMASVDLWLPAYIGDGLSGYGQLFFNTGLLPNRVYLPMHLAAVYDLNLNATVAFGVGVFGLAVVGIAKFLSGSN